MKNTPLLSEKFRRTARLAAKTIRATAFALFCGLALAPLAPDATAAQPAATQRPAKKDTFGISDKVVSVSDLGSPRIFRVSSDRPWKITSDAPWLTATPSSGEAGYFQVNITATKNTTKAERKAKLTVSASGKTLIAAVTQGKAGDYWNNGEVLWLNKHKKGKGVPILIVGDGFDREDLKKGGYWETAARTLGGVIKKSIVLRDFYDDYVDLGIYMAESEERGIESQDYQNAIPPRKSRFGGRMFGKYDMHAVRGALAEACPQFNRRDIRYCYVANGPFGGWAYLNDNAFVSVLQVADCYWAVHEFMGHAFSGLPDLYHSGTDHAYRNAEGVDFVSDPKKVKWAKFLKRPEYTKDGVGVHKLGASGDTMVYVAEDHRKSAMKGGTANLTALERYQVWKRIKRVAGEDDSVEEFMKYDIKYNVGKANKNALWHTPTPPVVRPWWNDIWEVPPKKK